MDGATVRRWMRIAAASIRENRDYLTQLDAAIGDADHGANMDRGFSVTMEHFDEFADMRPGELLTAVGALVSSVGGASGALWGTAFLHGGRAFGHVDEFDCSILASVLEGALAGVVEIGAATEGEKTMVDALAPASRALRASAQAGASVAQALAAARAAGEEGMRTTIGLKATKGRASYLGERSIGHQDPGATSTVLILAALEQAASGEGE